jgi:hypothetical protein
VANTVAYNSTELITAVKSFTANVTWAEVLVSDTVSALVIKITLSRVREKAVGPLAPLVDAFGRLL